MIHTLRERISSLHILYLLLFILKITICRKKRAYYAKTMYKIEKNDKIRKNLNIQIHTLLNCKSVVKVIY